MSLDSAVGGRCVPAVAFAEKIGLGDRQLFQQRHDVLGVPLDGERALGNIQGPTIALKVDRDDRSELGQLWR